MSERTEDQLLDSIGVLLKAIRHADLSLSREGYKSARIVRREEYKRARTILRHAYKEVTSRRLLHPESEK